MVRVLHRPGGDMPARCRGIREYGLGSSDQRTENVELATTVKSPQRSLDIV